ncbi:hypothetical protein ALO_01010 [Acetonema longum DSM 6540]|uniref:Uncharacterized protein n=1 Tax=Acetonema longum DSM 6540 TaxID=1009370 RepID=F7NDU5_9FIRM|nr:hypothetical protein ALO_01010 [Acetonema longum DSM 6540]
MLIAGRYCQRKKCGVSEDILILLLCWLFGSEMSLAPDLFGLGLFVLGKNKTAYSAANPD